jgi:hypothetical protein
MTNEIIALSIVAFLASIQLFIVLAILMLCIAVFRVFLPKSTDDPIIRLVKTTGIIGGLFMTMLIILITSK